MLGFHSNCMPLLNGIERVRGWLDSVVLDFREGYGGGGCVES